MNEYIENFFLENENNNSKKILNLKKEYNSIKESQIHYNNLYNLFVKKIPSVNLINFITFDKIINLIIDKLEFIKKEIKKDNIYINKIDDLKKEKIEKEKNIWFNEKERITEKKKYINLDIFNKITNYSKTINKLEEIINEKELENKKLSVLINSNSEKNMNIKREILRNNIKIKNNKKKEANKQEFINNKIKILKDRVYELENNIINCSQKKREANINYYNNLDSINKIKYDIVKNQEEIDKIVINQNTLEEEVFEDEFYKLINKKDELNKELLSLQNDPVNNINDIYEKIDNQKLISQKQIIILNKEINNLKKYYLDKIKEINNKYNDNRNSFILFQELIKSKKEKKQNIFIINDNNEEIKLLKEKILILKNQETEQFKLLDYDNTRCDKRLEIMENRLQNWDTEEKFKINKIIQNNRLKIIDLEKQKNDLKEKSIVNESEIKDFFDKNNLNYNNYLDTKKNMNKINNKIKIIFEKIKNKNKN